MVVRGGVEAYQKLLSMMARRNLCVQRLVAGGGGKCVAGNHHMLLVWLPRNQLINDSEKQDAGLLQLTLKTHTYEVFMYMFRSYINL